MAAPATAFLFGNVDKAGRLEQDVLDDDLRESLTGRDAGEYLDRVLGGFLAIDADADADGDPQAAADAPAARVIPAADAVDYSNFHELADDNSAPAPPPIAWQQLPPSLLPPPPPSASVPVAPIFSSSFPAAFSFQSGAAEPVGSIRAAQDDYDDDDEAAATAATSNTAATNIGAVDGISLPGIPPISVSGPDNQPINGMLQMPQMPFGFQMGQQDLQQLQFQMQLQLQLQQQQHIMGFQTGMQPSMGQIDAAQMLLAFGSGMGMAPFGSSAITLPSMPSMLSMPPMSSMSSMPSMPMLPSLPSMPMIIPPPPPSRPLPSPPVPPPRKVFNRQRLSELFPGFDQGRLRFSELFTARMPKRPLHLRLDQPKKLRRDHYYEVVHDDRNHFNKVLPARFEIKASPRLISDKTNATMIESEQEHDDIYGLDMSDTEMPTAGASISKAASGVGKFASQTQVGKLFAPVLLESWEDKITWGDSDEDSDGDDHMGRTNHINDHGKCIDTVNALWRGVKEIENTSTDVSTQQKMRFRNPHLDKDDWLNAIVFDDDAPVARVPFHLDDPKLALTYQSLEDLARASEKRSRLVLYKKRPDGKFIDRFNLSEDWLYESAKARTRAVRQSYGPTSLQHSLPAIKLHPQYSKPQLQLKELRSFHRPAARLPLNTVISFSRVKAVKRRAKDVDPTELMKTPKDISIRDTSRYVLVEYSEEYPPVMQNIGMANVVYNYYRKKDDKDPFVPKLTHGNPYILETVDASPFFGFGDVRRGQTIQVLYNNLFRAPIFEQHAPTTDFLFIRHTYHGKTKFFLREIPNMYVVGQMYPLQEVPRPQARKVTQALKARLQVVAYRLMWKDPYRRLRYDKLKKAFPMFTDAQIRQKLKEFAQYLKKGENTGWWKLKPHVKLPDEEGIRKIITPEQICLYQSTLVGQQRLRDAGYGIEDLAEFPTEEEEATTDIELQLAPWIITKNFLAAAHNKAMVKLFGPGDPTAIGEGFSFIRASMKEMFFKSSTTMENQQAFINSRANVLSHKYSIAEQQKEYREEIDRIWNSQLKSLGSKVSPVPLAVGQGGSGAGSAVDGNRANQYGGYHSGSGSGMRGGGSPEPFSPQATGSVHGSNETYSDTEDDGATSIQGSGFGTLGKSKVLIINRLIRNANGDFDWKPEVITDGRVVNAYLRHRKLIEHRRDDDPDPAGMSEEEQRKHRQRRTREHVARLQMKLGKRPTYSEFFDDHMPITSSSSSQQEQQKQQQQQQQMQLQYQQMQMQQFQMQQVQQFQMQQLQLQLQMQQQHNGMGMLSAPHAPITVASALSSAGPRLGNDAGFSQSNHDMSDLQRGDDGGDFDDLLPPPPEMEEDPSDYSHQPPASHPRVDLAEIFSSVIDDLIATVDTTYFMRPVSAIEYPDYHTVVHTPRSISDVRDAIRSLVYTNCNGFLCEFDHIVHNCELYHGPMHHITHSARNLANCVRELLHERRHELLCIPGASVGLSGMPQMLPSEILAAAEMAAAPKRPVIVLPAQSTIRSHASRHVGLDQTSGDDQSDMNDHDNVNDMHANNHSEFNGNGEHDGQDMDEDIDIEIV